MFFLLFLKTEGIHYNKLRQPEGSEFYAKQSSAREIRFFVENSQNPLCKEKT